MYVGGNSIGYSDSKGLARTTIDAAIEKAIAAGDIAELEALSNVANAEQAALIQRAIKSARCTSKIKDSLDAISTGRTQANNLKEKLAMEAVKSKPNGSTPSRMPAMSDTKNNLLAKDGWVKRVQNMNGVEIHYVENINTNKVIDFKFK